MQIVYFWSAINEFIQRIDSKLPYFNFRKWRALSKYAINSTVAVCTVAVCYANPSVAVWRHLRPTARYPEYAPDHFQKLTNSSLVHNLPVPQIFSYSANKQTRKQTRGESITPTNLHKIMFYGYRISIGVEACTQEGLSLACCEHWLLIMVTVCIVILLTTTNGRLWMQHSS